MYTQPAVLLTVLALASEVLSSTLGEQTARQNHARQARTHRRRGIVARDSSGDSNPCKREQSSSSSSGGVTSFRITDASTGNVTVLPATSYIRQANGEKSSASDSRQPLNKESTTESSTSDVLADERTSLEAEESSASQDQNTWSSEAASSSSTTSSAAPAGSSTATNSGNGMSEVTSWSGSAFEDWDFFTYSDPTHGDVNYISHSDAKSQNLIGIQDGKFKMSVSTGDLVNGKRNSVRISTKNHWKKGQLMVADINHIPEGCGTWPALWSIGATRAWPAGGEIDILEGVNSVAGNTYTLHTTVGCTMSGQSSSTSLGLTEDCQYQPGCSYKDRADNSFGPDFNAAGGGFYASFFDDSGIKIWFWSVNDAPASIKSGSPNMAEFGTPKATFESSTCDMDTFFDEEQMIIINTTLMGDWAGATFWNNGCTGTQADTLANAANFDKAYWLINSVKLYA